MYDEMWEDHTEEIFQSITIEQALRTSSKWGDMSLLSQMWAQVKLWEQSAFSKAINKYRYAGKNRTGTIKFRRYGTYEKKMVRSVDAETELTLGYCRTFGRSVPRCLSGFGNGNFYLLDEGQG